MNRMTMLENLENINNSLELTKKIELANKIIFHSTFLETEKLSIQFSINKFEYINDLQLFLTYRLEKYDTEKLFVDADCDVSLIAIIIYCKLLGIEATDEPIALQRNIYNSNHYKYEISQPTLPSFRGDTMTSIQYVLKKHIALYWIELDKNSQLRIDDTNNQFYELFSHLSNRGLLYSKSGAQWDEVFHDNSSVIWDVLDHEIKRFLNTALLIGNFIPMPIYINPCRNDISGTKDIVDVLLWNIYVFYQLGNDTEKTDRHLNRILTGTFKEQAKINYKIWLTYFKSWDNFIIINCLQDFVQNTGTDHFGRPFSMKTGQIIDCNLEDDYSSVPTTYEESKRFFNFLNDKILKRSERIITKVKCIPRLY